MSFDPNWVGIGLTIALAAAANIYRLGQLHQKMDALILTVAEGRSAVADNQRQTDHRIADLNTRVSHIEGKMGKPLSQGG